MAERGGGVGSGRGAGWGQRTMATGGVAVVGERGGLGGSGRQIRRAIGSGIF